MTFSYLTIDRGQKKNAAFLNTQPGTFPAGPFGDYLRRLGRWRFTSQIRSHGLLVITNSYRSGSVHWIQVLSAFFTGSEFVTLPGTICESWRAGSRWLGVLWTNQALWKIQCKDGYLECSRMSHHTFETICSGCHHRCRCLKREGSFNNKKRSGKTLCQRKSAKISNGKNHELGNPKKASILDLKLSEVRQVTNHFNPFFTILQNENSKKKHKKQR